MAESKRLSSIKAALRFLRSLRSTCCVTIAVVHEEGHERVQRWEFEPLRDANGRPVESRVHLPVRIKALSAERAIVP